MPGNEQPPSPELTRHPAREAKTASSRLRTVFVALAGAGALFVVARTGGSQLPALVNGVESLGAWGPIAFIGLYVLATVLFVPGSLLTLAGGALFGVASGFAYVFVAAVIGSCLAFLLARYAAREWVEARIGANPRFAALDRAVGDEGLKITFLLRLSPVFPFSFMNYALGLTRVSLRDYMIASLGMLPATFLYVYSGRVIGDVASLAGGAETQHGGGYYGVLALGLAATLTVTAVVTRIARRALADASLLEDPSPKEPR